MDDLRVDVEFFQSLYDDPAVGAGMLFPVRIVEQAGQFPFQGGPFVGAFFFQGPGFHDGGYLSHMEPQPLVGYPFVEEGVGFLQGQEVVFVGRIAEGGAVEREDMGGHAIIFCEDICSEGYFFLLRIFLVGGGGFAVGRMFWLDIYTSGGHPGRGHINIVNIFIENQLVAIGALKIALFFLGTSHPFILPLHSFQKRVSACRLKGNQISRCRDSDGFM
jgi:hypothetical protein